MPIPTIISTRNGTGSDSGYRDDLVAGDLIGLSLSNYVGITSVLWELIGRPEGSTAGGAGPEPILLATANSTAFNVDSDSGDFRLDGTYTAQATLNPGSPGQLRITTVLCRLSGLTIPGPGSSVRVLRKLGGFETLEDTSVPTVLQGWATELNRWLELLRETVTGGAGGFTTLAGAYSHGASSSDQTMVLHDSLGGGIVVDGSQSNFTGASALRVNTAAGGPVVVDRATGRVGIGIAAPLQSVHAFGAAPAVRLGRSGGAALDMMNVGDDLQFLNGATVLGIFKATGGLQADLGVGIGTPPATHPVLALGAASSAPVSASSTARFRYNEITGHAEWSENGGAYQPFSAAFNAYQTIDAAGTPLTQRNILNFAARLTAVDNSGATRTDIDLATTAVTPGSYNSTNLTVDAFGRITAASSGGGGTVTTVTGNAPIQSSGGTTPAISLLYDAVSIILNGGNAIQRAALTGDVSAGAGSNTTTIGAHIVTAAKFRQSVGLSVVGNSTNATADVSDVTATGTGQVLQDLGTTIGWAALAYSSLTGAPTIFYQTVDAAGTPLTQRPSLNFGSEFTAVDNSGATRTDISIASITGSKLTGTANTVPFFNGSGALAEATNALGYDPTNIRLGSRISSGLPLYQLHLVDNSGASDRGLATATYVNAITPAEQSFLRARGTFASPSSVAVSDYLHRIDSFAFDGTSYLNTVATGTVVSTTPTTGNVGADWFVAVNRTGLSSDPFANNEIALHVRSTGGIDFPKIVGTNVNTMNLIGLIGGSVEQNNMIHTVGAGSVGTLYVGPFTGTGGGITAGTYNTQFSGSSTWPGTIALVNVDSGRDTADTGIGFFSPASNVNLGTAAAIYYTSEVFSGVEGVNALAFDNFQSFGTTTAGRPIVFVGWDPSHVRFNAMALPGDGSTLWGNSNAAVSLSGTSGIRSHGGHLQYSQNGGAWVNFDAALTSVFYQTVAEAGTPLTQRAELNFDGSVVAVDNSGASRTDVGLPNVGPGAGTIGTGGIATITLDAKGRVTAATTGSYITALTGDVTATGPGSVAVTIAANAVTSAKFRASVANSLVGNPTGSPANVQDITLGAGLAFSGTTLVATGLSSAFYQTVDAAGTPLTQRNALSFSSDLPAIDNSGAGRTDVSLANAGAGAGTYGAGGVTSITLDAKGRVTAVTTATYLTSSGASPGTFNNITFNGNGLVLGGSNVAYLTSAFYQTVAEAGSSLTQRGVLNFDGTVVAADDVAHTRTNVGLPNVGPGAGLQGGFGISGIVLDAQGRVVSVNAATYLTQAYTTIQNNSLPVTQRSTLNFSTDFSVVDAFVSTGVSLANVGPGAGPIGGTSTQLIQGITLDINGRVTAGTAIQINTLDTWTISLSSGSFLITTVTSPGVAGGSWLGQGYVSPNTGPALEWSVDSAGSGGTTVGIQINMLTNTFTDTVVYTVTKNGTATGATASIPSGVTGVFGFRVALAWTLGDKFGIRMTSTNPIIATSGPILVTGGIFLGIG